MGIIAQLKLTKITIELMNSDSFKSLIKELNTHAVASLDNNEVDLSIYLLKSCADWTKDSPALAYLYALTLNNLGCAFRRNNLLD
jgi:hypothetical protein